MAQIDAETYKFLGETLGFWIQTGAFVLSAFYAARQVRALRIQTDLAEVQARRRATVDMTIHEKQDSVLRDARKLFADLRDAKNNNLTQYACRPSTEHPNENAAIMAVLNHYEFMAAGIREGAFDEAIYKRMKRSLVIRDWDALSGYVFEIRKQYGVSVLFVEFEWLVTTWKRDVPSLIGPPRRSH